MAKARKSTIKRAKAATKRRTVSKRASVDEAAIGKIVIGIVVGGSLLFGIAYFGLMGYRTAVASKFFEVKNVDIRGADRASADDIKRIVLTNSEKTGVWQADLAAVREKIEKLPFVRTASVSAAMPATIRVSINERVPVAIVRLSSGDQLIDGDGVILAPVTKPEASMPFVMRGWDESKTANAPADNLARIKLYKKMVEDWREFGLADRVKEINLADLREPSATIVDSGRSIGVTLAKDNFAKGLKSAIEAVSGKGDKIRSVNAEGVFPVLEYLNY